MKSLVEEASSVFKALEKAWEHAGKPESFSVKIFELPEKNFFGFTKKNAKVGIFFEEQQVGHVNARRNDGGHRGRRNNDQQRGSSEQRHSRGQDRNAEQRSTENTLASSGQRDMRESRDHRDNKSGGDRFRRNNDNRQSRPRRDEGDRDSQKNYNRYQSNELKDSGIQPVQDVSVNTAPAQQARAEEPIVERRILRVSNRQYDASAALNTKKDE